MRLRRLSFLVLTTIGAALCQSKEATTWRFTEVEWPIPAVSAAGPPAGPWNFGEVSAVATARLGNILVLHRGAYPLIEFDPTGRLVRSWGDGKISEGKVVAIAPGDRAPGGSGYSVVYGAAGCYACGGHSLRVDEEGFLWLVDAAAHAVYKMTDGGSVMLQLGTKGESGEGEKHFNLPTDVGFGPEGKIYVSDGYGGARVVKFSRAGQYLLEWGKRGTGQGEFGLPHNLVVDAEGKVYVTDRDNRRIQVFDSEGKFLDEWKEVGGVSTLYMTEDQLIWAGGVLRNLKGEVVARLPGEVGGHGTTVSQSGDVYIAQLAGRVQKFVRELGR